jgi:hypothetical protein
VRAAGLDFVAAIGISESQRPLAQVPVLVAEAWARFCSRGSFFKGFSEGRQDADAIAWEALIAAAIEDLLKSADDRIPEFGGSGVVLCIPDALSEDGQEDLLGFLRRTTPSAQLLWRPVAAALEFLATVDLGELSGIDPRQSAGCFLSVHCGLDGFEATLLELVRSEATPARLLPARRRPTSGESSAEDQSLGLALLQGSMAAMDSSRPRATIPRSFDSVEGPGTAFLPGTNALLQILSEFPSDGLHPAFSLDPEVIQVARRALAEHLLGALDSGFAGRGNLLDGRVKTTLHLPRGWGPHRPAAGRLSDWVVKVRKRLASSGDVSPAGRAWGPLRGVLVSGELAGITTEGVPFGQRLASALVGSISPRDPGLLKNVRVEGTPACPAGVLARGAARYAALSAAGIESYLDSLPAIETLLVSRGRPQWVSLLGERGDSSDPFVEGNREWVRDPHYGPLYIKPNAKQLDLLLWLGSEDRVKKVQIPVPPAPHRRRVMLEVRIKPAGGNARVKAVPEQLESFGRANLLLDWKRAQVEPKTKQDLVAEAEVPCPATIKRTASIELWRQVEAWMKLERPLDRLPQAFARSQALESLCTQLSGLLKKGIAEGGAGKSGIAVTAATDQDGNPPGTAGESGQQFQLLMRELARHCAALPVYRLSSNAMNALGLAALKNADADTIIKALIQSQAYDRESCTLMGGCLREEKSFNQLARVLHQRLEMTGLDNNNFIMGSFAEIIQYQEDITNGITSDGAAKLVTELIQSLEASFRKSRLKFLERNAIAIVAFLMRRRIFDEDFFAPDSQVAMEAKRVLQLGLQGVERGSIEPIGGRINAPVLMQRVIDYIDKRGSIEPLVFD